MYNEAAKKATIKYMKENIDKLTLGLPKGKKAEYRAHAETQGKSLTALIIELIEKDMKQEH